MRASRLASFLQIRRGEAGMVALVAALFALIDVGRGFGPNATDALFFRRFGVENLPYMYMGLGALNFLVTLVYTAGLSRFDRRRFFMGLLLALMGVLLVERAAIVLDSPALWPVMWLTVRMLSSVLGTFMWHLASDVTDARQAKRLFSLFTSASITGSIVGNLVTGPAARLLGTDNLLLLYAGLLVACFLITRAITRRYFDPSKAREAQAGFVENLRVGYNFVRGSSLMRLLAFGAAISSILYFAISFLFSQAVAESVADEAAIAGFLGVFNSITTAITLLVSLFLANRMFSTIGLANSILLLPVTYVAGFALFGINFSLPTAIGVRFGQRVLLSGVASTAERNFYSVVPSSRRGQVITFNFGVPSQIGTVLSGVLLILGATVLQRQQVFILGLVFSLLFGLLVWRMRREYGRALVDALRAGRFEVFAPGEQTFAGYRGNANAISVALAAMKDEKPSTRRLGVEILGHMSARSAAPALVEALADPDAEVRVAAVEALAWMGVDGSVEAVSWLLADSDTAVRATALRVLPDLPGETPPNLVATLNDLLGDADVSVRAGAAVALAALNEGHSIEPVLDAMLADDDPATRTLALGAIAQVTGHGGHGQGATIGPARVLEALEDASPGVRVAACHSLSHIGDEAAITPLTGHLGDPDESVRHAAARALEAFGASATPHILAVLENGHPLAQEAALEALSATEEDLLEPLQAFARAEIARLSAFRELGQAIPQDEHPGRASRLMCDTLEARAARSELRLVKTVGLLGNPEAMQLVGRGLQARDADTRAAAVETLETLGTRELAREIIPLLDAPPPDEDGLTTAGAMERLLADADSWMRALASRAAYEMDLRQLSPRLQAMDTDPDPIARESARDALRRWGEDESMETLQTVSSLERVLLLCEVPLFAGLSPDDLKQIADIAREELHDDGALLVHEGDEGSEMYVVAEGQVEVVKGTDGEETLLATRKVGDFLGEMALIESEPRFASVRAMGSVRVLVIEANAFDAILRDRPEVARALLRGLSRRLRESQT